MSTTLRRLLWFVISPLWVVSGLAMIYVMGEGPTFAAIVVFGASSIAGSSTVAALLAVTEAERTHELKLERIRAELYDKPLLPSE